MCVKIESINNNLYFMIYCLLLFVHLRLWNYFLSESCKKRADLWEKRSDHRLSAKCTRLSPILRRPWLSANHQLASGSILLVWYLDARDFLIIIILILILNQFYREILFQLPLWRCHLIFAFNFYRILLSSLLIFLNISDNKVDFFSILFSVILKINCELLRIPFTICCRCCWK